MGNRIVGVAGSPRKKGNTETLLDWVLDAAAEKGADVEKIKARDLEMTPCIECGGCEKKGHCVIDDDMQGIYPKVLEADWVILAAPLFFMNVPAHMKSFVDRFQCMWARKFVLDKPIRDDDRRHRGLLLTLGGTKGKTMFAGIDQLVKCYFSILDIEFDAEHSLYYRQVDARGDIKKHETARDDALRTAAHIAEPFE